MQTSLAKHVMADSVAASSGRMPWAVAQLVSRAIAFSRTATYKCHCYPLSPPGCSPQAGTPSGVHSKTLGIVWGRGNEGTVQVAGGVTEHCYDTCKPQKETLVTGLTSPPLKCFAGGASDVLWSPVTEPKLGAGQATLSHSFPPGRTETGWSGDCKSPVVGFRKRACAPVRGAVVWVTCPHCHTK